MGKTIKQVSAELNVSKPTVAKAIEQCGLSDALIRVGNRFELSDEQVEMIKSQISPIGQKRKQKRKQRKIRKVYRRTNHKKQKLKRQNRKTIRK